MIEKVSGNVHVETGVPGCNHSIIVTDEGVVMVDSPQFPSDAVKWRDYVRSRGLVLYIVNNEPHGDHVSGNFFFTGTVVGHAGTREAVLATPVKQFVDMVQQMQPASMPLVENYNFRPPTLTFTDKMTLYLGKHTIELMHMPGHTPSETAVYVPEEKVLFPSDNVVRGTMPFFTPQALPFEWIESLKRMRGLDVKVVVPGHGSVCDASYLGEMIQEIEAWINSVSDAMKKGASRDDVLKTVDMTGRYPKSPMPERMAQTQRMNLGRVYDVLSKKS